MSYYKRVLIQYSEMSKIDSVPRRTVGVAQFDSFSTSIRQDVLSFICCVTKPKGQECTTRRVYGFFSIFAIGIISDSIRFSIPTKINDTPTPNNIPPTTS